MAQNHDNLMDSAIPDDDDSTILTVNTPTDTNPPNDSDPFDDAEPSPFLVPWPGSTFIIRSVSSGKVIMLLDGQIVLTQPGGRGSSHWACVETRGWLGFRNDVSGKFLGHDKTGNLCCDVEQHQKWEYFCVRVRPEGGCVLLMTHWSSLCHVGFRKEQDEEKLAKIDDEGSDGMAWEFIKV